MKKEDFKDIFNPVYIESCNEFIRNGGKCFSVLCKNCPFDERNNNDKKYCIQNNYSDETFVKFECEKLVKSAKAFKEMVEEEKRKTQEEKMEEFKVGDRVKLAIDNQFHGMKGVITELMDAEARLQMDNEYNAKLELTMPFEYLEKIEDEPQVAPFELKEGMVFKVIGDKTPYTVLKIGYELGCERYYPDEFCNYSKDFIDWEETRKLNGIFLSDKERKPLGIHYESAKEMFDKESPEFKLEVGMRFKTLDIVELPPKYRNKILVAELTKVEGHIGVINEDGFYYIENKYIDWKNTENPYSLETKTSIESITSEQIDKWNEADSEKSYYVIYKEPSAKRHLSYEEALDEAKSKLLRSPNDKVCIMKCEAVVESKIEVKVNELK